MIKKNWNSEKSGFLFFSLLCLKRRYKTIQILNRKSEYGLLNNELKGEIMMNLRPTKKKPAIDPNEKTMKDAVKAYVDFCNREYKTNAIELCREMRERMNSKLGEAVGLAYTTAEDDNDKEMQIDIDFLNKKILYFYDGDKIYEHCYNSYNDLCIELENASFDDFIWYFNNLLDSKYIPS